MHVYVFYSERCDHCASLFKLINAGLRSDVELQPVCVDTTPLRSIPYPLKSVPTLVVDKDPAKMYSGEKAFHVIRGVSTNGGGGGGGGSSSGSAAQAEGPGELAAYEFPGPSNVCFSEIDGPGYESSTVNYVDFDAGFNTGGGGGAGPSGSTRVSKGGEGSDAVIQRLIEQRNKEVPVTAARS